MAIPHNPSLHYRPEIDGLRAIAVIPVVFFHAGFSLFSGGFVGVDVFFVISGYLITSILLKEMEKGTFSILNFYERRARRILPALFFVIFCCLPFAWFLLTPEDLKAFSTSLISVALFISNIYFYRNADYFAPAAEDQPLLHTWSLSVEEQFYVILPVVLLLCVKFARATLFLAVLTLTIVSFILCEYFWRVNPGANFYLLPTRVWELLVGSLAAIMMLKVNFSVVNNRYKSFFALLGFAFILISIFWFDKATPFPSVYALLPVFGTALVLSFSSAHNFIGKLLALKVLVAIGICSYSIYLWHQPIFVFLRNLSVDDLSVGYYFLAILFTCVLSVFTLYFIEYPFRKIKMKRNSILLASLGLLIVLAGIGFVGRYFNGFENRLNPIEVQQLAYYENYRSESRRERCFFSSSSKEMDGFAPECYGDNKLSPKLFLIGDSHAAALYQSVATTRPKNFDVVQLTMSGCYPILGNGAKGAVNCRKLSDARFDLDQPNASSIVVLHANWPTDQFLDKNNPLKNDLIKTIQTLSQQIRPTHIVLMGCVPTWTPTLPKYLLKKGLLGAEQIPDYIYNPDFATRNSCNRVLKEVAESQGITFFNPMDSLCVNRECLIKTKTRVGQTKLTTSDQTHLTYEGATIVVEDLLTEVFKNPKPE